MTVTMGAGAYNTLLRVYGRSPGSSSTGAPQGEWFLLGQHWGQQLEAAGAEVAAGAGQKPTRKLAFRVRWFPGWISVFRTEYRVQVGEADVRYGVTSCVEAAQEGTQRTLRLDLHGLGA